MNQTEIENLVVKLTADVNGYVKGFLHAQAQTLETTKHIQDASEKVKDFTESVTSFSQAALAGMAGLGAAHWFKEVFNLAGGMEHQFIGLSAAIRSNTDDVDNTLEAYKRFAEGMFEVTGTSKRTTLALLQMDEFQGLTAKRAMETARQAIALGAATGMDPRSLVTRLSMAQTGSGVQMLRRVPGLRGITDETELVDKANRLMAVGMDVSKAQMQSAAGMVAKLSEELEEVKKQFGKLLLDALKPGIELLTKTVQWFKDLDERTKLIILSLAGMTVGVVALVNGLRLLNMALSIVFSGTGGLLAVMLPISVASALWAEHLGGVSKAWELVKAKAQQFWEYVRPVAQGVWNAIRVGALVMASVISSVWDHMLATFEPTKRLLIAGWHKIGEAASWVADKIGPLWEPMEIAAASFAATLAAIGAILYVAIPRPLEALLPLVMKVFLFLVRFAVGVLPVAIALIKDAVVEVVDALNTAGSIAGSVLASIGEWFASLPGKIQNAMNWIANLVEGLPPVIHQTAKDGEDLVGIVEWVARAFRWVNEQASILANHISRIASSIRATISPAVDYIAERLAALWNSIVSVFNSIAPYISSAFEYIFEGIAPAISSALGKVLDVLKAVAKTLSDQLSNLKWDLQGIVTVTMTVIGTVVSLLLAKRAVWTSIVFVVQALYTKIAWIVTVVQTLVTWVSGLSRLTVIVAGMAAGFALLGDKFLPVAAAFLAWLAWAGPKMSFIVGLITLLAARTDLVWQALAKVKEFFSFIANSNEWIKNVADKIASFFRWVGASIGPAMAAIGEFFSSIWQSAVEAFDLIASAASQAFGVVREVLGGAFELISEAVANFNWNLQNTIMIIAAAIGIIAGMATFLLVWATTAKVVLLVMTLLTTVLGLNKLAWLGLNIMMAAGNAMLVITGIQVLATTIGWVGYKLALVMVTLAKGAFTLASIAATAALAVLLALLIVVAAVVLTVVVVAFIAAANAVMALVEALKAMMLFSGAADVFRHWKGILGGLVTAIQVDMGMAWRHVQDAMHLAGEEAKAYWPPIWARIKEGFTLLWDLVAAKFVASFIKMIVAIQKEDKLGLFGDWKEGLKAANEELDKARNNLDRFTSKPIELGGITTSGMDAARAQVEANIANAEELAKLKKAADEEADKAAKKHKEELDTATKLNNLAQQHNELKQAELVLANSADALYRIQAYRASQQASLEARAAQMRKDVLDKEPDKGPVQAAFEAGLAADKRRENVASVMAKAQIESAKTPREAMQAAEEWSNKVSSEYNKALEAAKGIDETLRVINRFKKENIDSELAVINAREQYAQSDEAKSNEALIADINGGGWGEITALLREIRDSSKDASKRPALEVKPVGLK